MLTIYIHFVFVLSGRGESGTVCYASWPSWTIAPAADDDDKLVWTIRCNENLGKETGIVADLRYYILEVLGTISF
jgi:hypothetical protein